MLYKKYEAKDCVGATDESTQIISEAILAEQLSRSELDELCEAADVCNDLVEQGIVQERTIVRLDKHAKLNRAFMAAVFQIAKEKNDPKFKKLLTIWNAERKLEKYLINKYQSAAMKRAKVAVANLGKRKKDTTNRVVAKAVSGAKKQFNEGVDLKTAVKKN